MYMILTKDNDGKWERLEKRYKNHASASGVQTRLMNTGKYDTVIACPENSQSLVVEHALWCILHEEV